MWYERFHGSVWTYCQSQLRFKDMMMESGTWCNEAPGASSRIARTCSCQAVLQD